MLAKTGTSNVSLAAMMDMLTDCEVMSLPVLARLDQRRMHTRMKDSSDPRGIVSQININPTTQSRITRHRRRVALTPTTMSPRRPLSQGKTLLCCLLLFSSSSVLILFMFLLLLRQNSTCTKHIHSAGELVLLFIGGRFSIRFSSTSACQQGIWIAMYIRDRLIEFDPPFLTISGASSDKVARKY